MHINASTWSASVSAFLNSRTNYTTVKIGSSVIDIENNPFTGATSVTAFTGNTTFTTADSNKQLLKGSILIACANGSGASATLSQTTIGNGANVFTNPTAITTVTLSSTTSGSLVGASAFNGCTALATVSIARPDVWTGTMGASAFQSKAITLTLTGNYAPATNLTNALPNVSGSTLHLNISGTWSVNLMPFLNAKTNYSVTASASVTAISASTFTGLTLTNASWGLISLISKYNIASNLFAVGDTKTITITNYGEATFAILGFNHDDLTSGGKAGITFGMENLLGSNQYAMFNDDMFPEEPDEAWYDWYYDVFQANWEGSNKMRTQIMPNIISNMPSDLAAAIKTVNKRASDGVGSTNTILSQDKLFLFSKVEIDGLSDVSEGAQYEYYITIKNGATAAGRIKYQNNGTGSTGGWILRSTAGSSMGNFLLVLPDRYEFAGGREQNAYGYLCFGFCI